MRVKFDIPQLAAEFTKRHTDHLTSGKSGDVEGLETAAKARLNKTLGPYVERLLERYGKGKSFFIRSEAIPLYDFFVPLDLTTQVRRLTAPGINSLAKVSSSGIISGSGGSGKSMMMRHLLISSITNSVRIPAFLELRQLNQTSDTIRSALISTLRAFGLDIDEKSLDAALEGGQLVLLLDGFDEVEGSSRKRIISEVQKLVAQYPQNWLFMSSRPDSALQGWETVTEYRVAPLTLRRAADLVKKLPFEVSVKKAFIQDMQEGLFAKHESFLSNPLLLSIMLLTYGDVAHIPHKLSTFYSQAFEALFHRHDALKGGFQRDRRSGLDILDYGRAFAAFSLQSYDNREFSFTPARALELIANARRTAMLDFDDQAFLDDAVQAVCLLLEEGLDIAFAHRSFQEYFVARYVQLSPPEVKPKLVERFVETAGSDSVIPLLWELDPYIVEKHYLLPKLAQIREITGVSKIVGITHLQRHLSRIYNEFLISRIEGSDRVVATVADQRLHTVSNFAYQRYRGQPVRRSARAQARLEAEVLEAFTKDFGGTRRVPAKSVRARGHFVRAVAETGGWWSRAYLQDLLDIEQEIRAKHAMNRESLEQILAGHRSRR